MIIAGNEAGDGVALIVDNQLEFILRVVAGSVFVNYIFDYAFVDFVFFCKPVSVVDWILGIRVDSGVSSAHTFI